MFNGLMRKHLRRWMDMEFRSDHQVGASPHLKSALRKRIGHSFGSKVPMQKLHLEGLAICKRFQSSNPDGCCVREVN